jgi:hypothetical protein
MELNSSAARVFVALLSKTTKVDIVPTNFNTQAFAGGGNVMDDAASNAAHQEGTDPMSHETAPRCPTCSGTHKEPLMLTNNLTTAYVACPNSFHASAVPESTAGEPDGVITTLASALQSELGDCSSLAQELRTIVAALRASYNAGARAGVHPSLGEAAQPPFWSAEAEKKMEDALAKMNPDHSATYYDGFREGWGLARAPKIEPDAPQPGTWFSFEERTQVLRYLAMNSQGGTWPIDWNAEIVKRVLEKIQPRTYSTVSGISDVPQPRSANAAEEKT